MDAKDALRSTMNMSLMVLNRYIGDMNDADLMLRPSEGCNHLAWQLGHLISSEVGILNMMLPGAGATLPEGFAEQHSKEMRDVDDPTKFCTKQEYVELFEQVRAKTQEALAALPDAELDASSPEQFRQHFETAGQLWTLIAIHPMMHAGQFAVVRRKLGKPIII